MIVQHAVGEHVMNIRLDFRTQQNLARKKGLNLAAGTQRISPFVTPSLKKTDQHIGIRNPSRLFFFFFLKVEDIRVQLSWATTHPPESSRRADRLWGLHFSCRKGKKTKTNQGQSGDMTALPCGILHFTLIPTSHQKLYLNKCRDWGFQRQFPLVFPGRKTLPQAVQEELCTGAGESALISLVHLFIGSFGFLPHISGELEVEPGKLGNEPDLGERSTVWAPEFLTVPLVTAWDTSGTLQVGWGVCAAQQGRMGRFERQNILLFIRTELQENKW